MPPKDAPQVRLDSWKEIAAYLRRGERTVKRWEEERGLPVHRVPGGKGGVYAFSVELDEWLGSESVHKSDLAAGASPPDQSSAELTVPAAREPLRSRWIL